MVENIKNNIGIELGKGAYGVVYTVKNDPGLAVKVSDKFSNCRKWSDEYKKIKKLMKPITHSHFYNKLKIVKILEPLDLTEENPFCYMLMDRIYRPEKDFGPTLQSLFGEKDMDIIHKGRGQFIGLKQIKKIIGTDIQIASYELGVAMGLIHFVGKNDAYDIEVFFGKEIHTKKCRFYIADFDLSEEIKMYDEKTIERIVWSLQAVPYFPNQDNEKLLDLFVKGYTEVAVESKVDIEIFKKIMYDYLH